jgi:hypothetical protein
VVGPAEDSVVAFGSVGMVGSSRTVALTGVQARGIAGDANFFYWSTIDDSQTPNWQNVDNLQSPNWENVNNSQLPDWADVEMTV